MPKPRRDMQKETHADAQGGGLGVGVRVEVNQVL